MILIVGGAYQGKLKYVLDTYDIPKSEVYSCSIENGCNPDKKVVCHVEQWVLDCMDKGNDAVKEIQGYLAVYPEAILICEDISCGVVPMDQRLRMWREAVGRCMAALSQQADEVVRLFCGIPTKLK